jgi:serine/threonine protein kinase
MKNISAITKLNYFENLNLKLKKICCGKNFTIFLTECGKLFSVGENANGELGTGENQKCLIIKQIYFFKDNFIIDISCSYNYSICVSKNGEIFSWGSDNLNGHKGTLPIKIYKLNKKDEVKKIEIEENENEEKKIEEIANEEKIEEIENEKKEDKEKIENFFKNIKIDNFKMEKNDIKIIEEIDENNFAIIYKANYNNDIVAIKKFKQVDTESNHYFYKKELKLISNLNHSNIVNFIGFIFEKNGIVGIVLEYCELKTLKSFIEKNLKLLKWKLKLKLLLDVSKGMEYIHFKKLIHRDLKLENVLISKGLIAKITNFDISRESDINDKHKTIKCGTSLYMAPEVVTSGDYDQKCDVFSFAIMMFQLLTKKIDNIYQDTISNDNVLNVELQVAINPNFRPLIPKKYLEKKKYFEFIELMKKCWNQDPKERPSFNDITMTLQKISDNIVKLENEKNKNEENKKVNHSGLMNKSEKIDIIFSQVSTPYKYFQNIKTELLEIFNYYPTLEPKLGSLS